MKQPDSVRVAHMREAAEKCVALWRGREFSDLQHDEIAALATVRLLEILGKAAKNVSPEGARSAMAAARRAIAWCMARLARRFELTRVGAGSADPEF